MEKGPEQLSDEGEFDNDFNTRQGGRGDDDFDDDFNGGFEDSPPAAARGDQSQRRASDGSQVVSNRPYDEALDVDDGQSMGTPGPPDPQPMDHLAPPGGRDDVVKNQPYDETMELSSEASMVDDARSREPRSAGASRPDNSAISGGEHGEDPEHGLSRSGASSAVRRPPPTGPLDLSPTSEQPRPSVGGSPANDEDDEDEEDEDGLPTGGPREVTAGQADSAAHAEGELQYDPSQYAHLDVSAEVREIFEYIGRYKPHSIDLETKMRPFIPDYIPAVGDIDPFVKVPRPDGAQDGLGLTVLDEPTSKQSDPVVLQLQLRAITKASGAAPALVRSIEGAEKDPKAIQAWIDSIKELHRNKPQPTVTYSKPMPDIEELMQIWPAEFEEMLDKVKLPGADIDMPLKDYARLVCSILDIPVHNSLMEPLHLLFTLFSDFKANVHFQQQVAQPSYEDEQGAGAGPGLGGGMPGPRVEGQSESLSFD